MTKQQMTDRIIKLTGNKSISKRLMRLRKDKLTSLYNEHLIIEKEWQETQTITSAKTSLNQVPAIMKNLKEMTAHIGCKTIDYGGGKYDRATKFLKAEYGIDNSVIDPFNRTVKHNDSIRANIKPVKAIFCCNVLNVINSSYIIKEVIQDIKKLSNECTTIYIQIYEGNKSGWGDITTKGYQRNETAPNYRLWIEQAFNIVGSGWTITKLSNTFKIEWRA